MQQRTRLLLALGAALPPALLVLAPPGAASAATPECDGHRATIVGTSEVTRGTPHRDVIVARFDIFGGGGNDLICGEGTRDVIHGGAGDDRLLGLSGSDVLYGGSGRDTLEGGSGRDTLFGGKGDDDLRGGRDWVPAPGDVFGDSLDGGPGNDRLDAGLDPRRPAGDAGDPDSIEFAGARGPLEVDLQAGTATAPGAGHDTIVAEPLVEIVGTPYDDQLTGSDGPDFLFGGGGSDLLDGRGGDDVLRDPELETLVHGHFEILDPVQHNTLLGGAGNDSLEGQNRDALDGGDGDDSLGTYLPQPGWSADGGPGTDEISLLPPTYPLPLVATVDGPDQTYSWRNASFHLAGVEHLDWSTGQLVYLGTAADETVDARGAEGVTAYMAGGDDTVFGTLLRDYVDGGPGTDTADLGHSDGDTCVNVEEGPC